MRGFGTVINVLLIVAGGVLGILVGKRFKERIRETLLTATGVAVLFLGIGGVVEKMITINAGSLKAGGTLMLILSIAVGSLIGEFINIDRGLTRFGEWLREKSGSRGDNSFVDGFVSASCTVCIGAMAVVGSINDGISGDYSVLLAKGILDAIIVCIIAAAKGKGAIASAIPVLLLQGIMTVLAMILGSFITPAALDNLSLVGSVLIFCVGINLVWDKKIRVANMLPSIVIAALMSLIPI